MGRLTASDQGSWGARLASSGSRRLASNCSVKTLYSSQRTSWTSIQKGETRTSRWGPSSLPRSSSSSGLPMRKVPPRMGTISKVTATPGMRSW